MEWSVKLLFFWKCRTLLRLSFKVAKKQQQLSLISSPRRSVRETLLKSDFSSSDAAFLSGGLQQRSESFFIETDSYSHILGQWTFTVFAQLFYRHCKYFTSNGCFQSHIICSIIDFRRLCRVKLLIMASDYSAELSIYCISHWRYLAFTRSSCPDWD